MVLIVSGIIPPMQAGLGDESRGAWIGILIAGAALVSGWLPPLAGSGLLLLLVGIGMVVFPGNRRLSPWLVVPFWVLALAPLLVFGMSFLELRGVRLPLQAWGVGRWLPVYYAGLLFAWWLAARRWNRDQIAGIIAGTVLVEAVVLVLAALLWMKAGGPLGAPLTGPFSSPNSFGLLMAIGGASCAALVFNAERGLRWWWLVGMLLFLLGGLLSQSRAGVGLLLLGVLIVFGLRALPKSGTKRLAAGAVMVAFGLVVVALVLPFLPEEVQRVGSEPLLGESYRVAIQADALKMAAERPLTGVGLGNFQAFFPLFQEGSASNYRVTHAENDLLHFAAEVGIIATFSLVVVLAYVAVRLFVAYGKSGNSGALGLAIFIVFGVHLFIDQSGHQVGLVAVAMLLLSTGWPALGIRTSGLLMRGAGGVAVVAAFGWLVIFQGYTFPANEYRWERVDRPPPEGAYEWAAARLPVAPLDWRAVELAAHRELQAGNLDAARELFERLKLLSPFSTATAEREMRAWMGTDQPELGLDAASRWLRWSESPQREARFLTIFRMNEDPGFAGSISDLAQDDWRLSLLSALQLSDERDDQAYENLNEALERTKAHAEAFRYLVAYWPEDVEPSDLREMREIFREHPDFFKLQALEVKADDGQLNEATDEILRIPPGETLPDVILYARRRPSPTVFKIAELLQEGATHAAETQLKVNGDSLPPELQPFFRGWILAVRGRDLEAWEEFREFIRLRSAAWALPRGNS